MARKLLLSIIMLSVCISISAQDDPKTVLQVGTSLRYGRARELVYYGASTSQLMSELLWDIPPVLFGELGVSRMIIGNLSASLSGSMKLAGLQGSMTNYDWLKDSSGTYFGEEEYQWTHYSRSDVTIAQAWEVDFRISLEPRNSMGFYGGARILYWEWTDQAQEYIYSHLPSGYYDGPPLPAGESPFRFYEGTFGGVNAIDYLQHLLIPYLGISLGHDTPSGRLAWGFSFSPATIAYARDHHKLRDTVFEDYAFPAISFSTGASYVRHSSGPWTAAFTADFTFMPDARSDTVMTKEQQAPVTYLSQAGIGRMQLSVGMHVQYRF